jgi:hypothetical protein
MMDSYLSFQGQRRRLIMSDPSRRGTDRASRLARAAAFSGGSGKVCPADRGIQESFGIMVNYLYDHDSIEENHKAFLRGTIVRSQEVDALMQGPRA